MGLSKFKNSSEEFKPYYMVNGTLTKEGQIFCLLWEGLVPFFDGLENGIDKNRFQQIVQKEKLDRIPDGDGYGSYRKIVFSEGEMRGQAWTMAIFPCCLTVDSNPQTFFVVTATVERGGEGTRRYFKEEEKAFAYFCAWLRSMKDKH